MTAVSSRRKRANLGLLALEPRWMFDGAAAADAAHAAPDAAAKALIPDAPAPVQVRAADPIQDSGKKEVVFVDTSVAGYQTLEAAVKPGVEVEEIDGSQSGLAQIAKWAETHTGYDSVTVIGHGTEASLQLGTDTITDASLSNVVTRAELAEIGSAMKSGGQLLIDANGVGQGADGHRLVADIATATGATVGAFTDSTGQDGNWTLDSSTGAIQVQAADPSLNGGKTEVVFIDTSVADYRTLMAAVKPGIEIELIDGNQGGFAQIAKWADTHTGYDSISILSHGAEGEVKLGTDIITDSSLADASIRAELSQIGHSLTAGGDILLYGCDVAAGADGQKLITDLAAATGADVAASTDATGSTNLGGNWILERTTGSIEATRLSVGDYSGRLVAPFSASGFTTAGTVAVNSTTHPFSSVTISDTNASDSVSATITFTAAAGTLSGTGLTGSNGSYTLSSATPATLQSRLEALTFTPAQTGTVDFTLNLAGIGTSNTTFVSAGLVKGMTGDSSGNIYVSNAGTGTVDKYASDGSSVASYGTGLSGIRGVAVDSNGNIFISDFTGGQIVKVDSGGNQTVFNTTVGGPAGLAVDSAGNLYATGYTDGKLYKISADGNTVTVLATGLHVPTDVARDSAGNLYVSEYGSGSNVGEITKIPYNSVSQTYGATVNIDQSGSNYSGIFVDKFGNIFATIYNTSTPNKVVEIPYDSTSSSYGSVTAVPGTYTRAWGIYVDSGGNIFVASSQAQTIEKVSGKSYSNATTHITVTAANTAPVFVNAAAQPVSVGYNSAAVDLKAYLHANDADASQTETWTQSSAPSHGTLSFSSATATSGSADITPGGTITYTPTTGYSGTDSFSVQVSDGQGGTATRTFNITVAAPPNTAPVFVSAAAQSLSVGYNSAAVDLKPYLHANDSDSSQTETWTQSGAPSHGTLSFSSATSASGNTDITPGGAITYTPTQGYSGTDTFTIQVGDGNATTTKTFTVTIAAAPVIAPPPPPPPPPKADPVPIVVPPPVQPTGRVDAVVTIVRDPTPPSRDTATPPPISQLAAPQTADKGNGEKGSGERTSGSAPVLGVVQAPASIVLAPTSQLTAAPVEGAFRVPVISADQRASLGGEALIAVRPVAQVQETAAGLSFSLPADTFAHTRADAVVNLSAGQQDGQPLPPWLNFNPKTGTFSGKPPADLQGTLVVRVVARDQNGREAIATIQIKAAEQAPGPDQRSGDNRGIAPIKLGNHTRDRTVGKVAFTQQLKMAARNTGLRRG
jgi:sugar lactone lactonase YvrE